MARSIQKQWLVLGVALTAGCAPVARTPNAQHELQPASAPPPAHGTDVSQAPPPDAPSCTPLPTEVTISIRERSVQINGKQFDELTESKEYKLLGRFLPCVGREPHHFTIDVDPTTAIRQLRGVLLALPVSPEVVDELRIGKAAARKVHLASSTPAVGHWVHVTVRTDGIHAWELARTHEQEIEPEVVKEAHPRSLGEAIAFVRATCAKHSCLGLIFAPAPDSPASVLDSALAAVGSASSDPVLLELEGPGDSGDKNDLRSVGQLAPPVIQQTVRDGYGRFRACYESGLARNAQLQGRAIVRFVIEPDGSVRNAEVDSSSDLPDNAVLQCIVEGFKQLRFPRPNGGIVNVMYPILLSPG